MLIFGAYRLYLYAAKSYIRIKILAAYVINDPIIHISQLKKRGQLKCHTVTKLVFLPKVAPIWLKFIQIHHHIQCTTEIYMADGQLPINWPSMPWNVWKCSVSSPCHTVTFFHSEHMSSKYIPRTRFISLNDYDDDVPRFSDDIVIWCIQMYSVIRINNVIKLGSGIRVIADCRLPPALLDQNWFVERVIWKVLLLHNKILNCCLAMVNPFFNWFFFRYFLILSAAPVASILASDMLSQKFTKNWQYTPQNWIMATISGPKRNNLNNQIFQQL